MILELEKQVCSLDSSKRLKEFGFPQESLFYWFKPTKSILDDKEKYYILCDNPCPVWMKNTHQPYSAYTVSELGELLPFTVHMQRTTKNYKCYNKIPCKLKTIESETAAEAMAQMLIYLAERNLIGRRGK